MFTKCKYEQNLLFVTGDSELSLSLHRVALPSDSKMGKKSNQFSDTLAGTIGGGEGVSASVSKQTWQLRKAHYWNQSQVQIILDHEAQSISERQKKIEVHFCLGSVSYDYS